MKFGVGHSHAADATRAGVQAAEAAARAVGDAPDLALVFLSRHHFGDYDDAARAVRATLRPRVMAGTTAEAVIDGAREIEKEPAVVVWAARLPGVGIHPFVLEYARTHEGDTFLGLPDELALPSVLDDDEDPPDSDDDRPAVAAGNRSAAGPRSGQAPGPLQGSAVVLMGDPFTFPVDRLLNRLNREHPGLPVVGGMASAGGTPGDNRLFLDDRAFDAGAVGVHLQGGFRLRTVVSQGCRPVGRPMVITKADGHVVFQLGGRPAWDQLRGLLEELSPRDRELLRTGNALMVGRVIDEYKGTFSRGDFLIRNFLGYDPENGVIAVDDQFRVGQTVQFHLRDASAADEDLRELLGRTPGDAAGGLLFTCNGRGSRMFGGPDHDAAAVQGRLGPLPVAGFFAAGELGPVGGRNFIHGFTASLALFSPADPV